MALTGSARAWAGMETADPYPRLRQNFGSHLRQRVDAIVRVATRPPAQYDQECGTDLRDLSGPVLGWKTCRNRFWRRRSRRRD